MTSLHKYFNEKGRKLGAKSDGLKPNALNVASFKASCQFFMPWR